jgi:hypothetical protein
LLQPLLQLLQQEFSQQFDFPRRKWA